MQAEVRVNKVDVQRHTHTHTLKQNVLHDQLGQDPLDGRQEGEVRL